MRRKIVLWGTPLTAPWPGAYAYAYPDLYALSEIQPYALPSLLYVKLSIESGARGRYMEWVLTI
jgi:hypothetical protein